MKVYVKVAEARPLCGLPGWLMRGTLLHEDIPVEGVEVRKMIDDHTGRMYRVNGRYVVYNGKDHSKFYELVD